MKTLLTLGVITISLIAFATTNAFSQAPTGSITNLVADPHNAVYDATLAPLQTIEIDITQDSSSDLLITFDDPYTQDGKGKLAGAGPTQVAVTNDPDVAVTFLGAYQTKGTIKGNNGLTSLRLASKASGTANLEGTDRNLSVSATYSITIDSVAGTVSGTVREKASASGLGSTSGSDTIDDVIPPELGDGSWTLVVNFGEVSGTKLTGTATVTLATGQVYPFNLKGTFVSATGQSKLSLTGVDDGAGSKLTVTLQGSTVSSIKGKIAGQVVSFLNND
jgi:hypothetical protein